MRQVFGIYPKFRGDLVPTSLRQNRYRYARCSWHPSFVYFVRCGLHVNALSSVVWTYSALTAQKNEGVKNTAAETWNLAYKFFASIWAQNSTVLKRTCQVLRSLLDGKSLKHPSGLMVNPYCLSDLKLFSAVIKTG